MTTPLTLPAGAVNAIAAEVRRFGQQDVETGGFVLAPYNSVDIVQVALAATAGIIRRGNHLQISAGALARLFDYADDHNLYAPGQFHSHQQAAFLSHADQTYGLRVEGFISAVVPAFANPPTDPSAWGWWAFHDPCWVSIPPARLTPGRVRVIRFDEHGIENHSDVH